MVPDSGKFTYGGHKRERFTTEHTGGTRGRDSPQSTRRTRRRKQRKREGKRREKRDFISTKQ
jgi:hypothetical protein